MLGVKKLNNVEEITKIVNIIMTQNKEYEKLIALLKGDTGYSSWISVI